MTKQSYIPEYIIFGTLFIGLLCVVSVNLENRLNAVGNKALYQERVALQQSRELDCLQEIAAKNNGNKASIQYWRELDDLAYEQPLRVFDRNANSTHWNKKTLKIINIGLDNTSTYRNEIWNYYFPAYDLTPVEFTRTEKESCSQPLPGYEEVLG